MDVFYCEMGGGGVIKKKSRKENKNITIKKDEGVKRGGAYKSGCGLDADI